VLQDVRSTRAREGEIVSVEVTDVLVNGDEASAAVSTETESGSTGTEVNYLRLESGVWVFTGDEADRCG